MQNSNTIQAVTLESIAQICNRSVSSARTYVNGLGVATKAHGTVLPYDRMQQFLDKKIDSIPENAATQLLEALVECEPEQAYWLRQEIERLHEENKDLKADVEAGEILISDEKTRHTLLKSEYEILERTRDKAIDRVDLLESELEELKEIEPNHLNRAGAAITSFTQSLLTLYLVIFIIITAETLAQAPLYVALFGSNQIHGITAAIIIQFVLFLAATTSSIEKKKNWYDSISLSEGGIWVLAAYNAIMNITVLFQNPTDNFWTGAVKIIVATTFAFSIAFVGDQIKLKQNNSHAVTN